MILSFVSFVGFAEGQKEAGEEEPIRIGLLDAMSGVFGVFGKGNSGGTKLAIHEINEAGGIMGRRVELVIEDTEANTEVTARKARKLILQDEVDLIIGSASTSTTAVIMSVTNQYDVMHINAEFDSHSTFKEKHDHDFNLCSTCNESERGRMVALSQEYDASEIKRWFIFYPDYSFGHDMRDIYTDELSKWVPGAEIVGMATHPLGEADFSTHITKILDANPQVVVSLQWAGDLSNFITQANTYDFFNKVPIFSASTANVSAIVALKDACPDMWFITDQANPYFDYMEEWRQKYYDYIGEWPVTECAPLYYDAVYFYKAAVEKAGTTDDTAVAEAMETLDFNGVSGKRDLRADHLVDVEFVMVPKLGPSDDYDWKVPQKVIKIPYEQVALSKDDLVRLGCEWCKGK